MPTTIERISGQRHKGCFNFKGRTPKPKVAFNSKKEADDFLRGRKELGKKISYECELCGKIHVGRPIRETRWKIG